MYAFYLHILRILFSGLQGIAVQDILRVGNVLCILPNGTEQYRCVRYDNLVQFPMGRNRQRASRRTPQHERRIHLLARRVIVAYRRAVRIFDDTHADDIGAYIEWLSTFTYWTVIFGVGCGLLTFLPNKYVFIWILSSIPFYSYLFYSYQNYLLFYEQVENAFEQDIQSEEELLTDTETEPKIVSEKEVPVSYTEIIEKVANWIKTDGYVQQGLTIKELSEILHTNRTYLSAYIKTTYKMTFREWITGLRLEYAKNILKEHPEINIQKLAESSGFLSRSNFIKSFTEKEGCTPAKWKKANQESGLICVVKSH